MVRHRMAGMIMAAGATVVVSACGGGGSGGSASSAPLQKPSALQGDVGHNDAFHIALTDENGVAIRHLAAGSYPLTIRDESGIHDFHLKGAGVNEATTVPSTATRTVTVTFHPGTYTFMCDPHASQMHGKFVVS